MFETLGIERDSLYTCHRTQINKIKIRALTGYDFDGIIENGEDGLKNDLS